MQGKLKGSSIVKQQLAVNPVFEASSFRARLGIKLMNICRNGVVFDGQMKTFGFKTNLFTSFISFYRTENPEAGC